MLTEVICGVLGSHNMVARNINISIQNCKTEDQSQTSLCCQPKLVSDLVQASNGYNFGRDSKDASTSNFSSSSFHLFFFTILCWCGFYLFLTFLCTCCLFLLILFLLQSESASGKGCKKEGTKISQILIGKISSFSFLMWPDLNNKGTRTQNNLVSAIMLRTKI